MLTWSCQYGILFGYANTGRYYSLESIARPNNPDDAASWLKLPATIVAASTAWLGTLTPPTVTTSVYTIPDAPLPSP